MEDENFQTFVVLFIDDEVALNLSFFCQSPDIYALRELLQQFMRNSGYFRLTEVLIQHVLH